MAAVRALLSTINGLAQGGLAHGGALVRGRIAAGAAAGGRAAGVVGAAQPSWDEGAYAHAGVEPLLEELLRDPVVHLLMRADRLEPAQVRRLLRAKQQPGTYAS